MNTKTGELRNSVIIGTTPSARCNTCEATMRKEGATQPGRVPSSLAFGFHFMEMHCPGLSACSSDVRNDPHITLAMGLGRNSLWYWEPRKWGVVTGEQRKHRRTILSLLPSFGDHPVWRDIERYAKL